MFGKKPDVSLIRVIGSLAYVHVKKDKRSGFSPHMEKAIFVGYPIQYKGWEFFNPVTKKFILSDCADFDERVFPGLSTCLPEPPAFPPSTISPTQSAPTLVPIIDDDSDLHEHTQMRQQVGDLVGEADTPSRSAHQPPAPPAPPAPQPEPEVRCSARARVPPAQWQSNWYKASYRSGNHLAPPPAPVPPYQNPPPHVPSSDEDSDESESDAAEVAEIAYYTLPEALEVAFKAGVHDDSPKSYREAMTCADAQKHHDAACDEIKALLENGTWELATLPPGRKAIGCMGVCGQAQV